MASCSNTRIRWSAPTVVAAVAACAPDELPHYGVLQYHSDSFSVYATAGLEACGGTYAFTEGWLASFRDHVGDYSSQEPHTFYWLTPEKFVDSPCPNRTGACAAPLSGVIYSTLIPFEHELVHVELGGLSLPPSLLTEGVAEAFGSVDSPDNTELADLESYADEELVPGYGYETSGRFTRFLIDRFGLDQYFALFVALDGKHGLDAIATAVGTVLAVDFAELNAEFKTVTCAIDRWRFYDYECTALPLTPWESETRWSSDIDLACGSDDVLGPRRGIESRRDTDFIWTLRAFEVAEAQTGGYHLKIDSPDQTAVATIFDCSSSCTDPGPMQPAGVRVARVDAGGESKVIALNPGRYWVRVEHTAATEDPVRIVVESRA